MDQDLLGYLLKTLDAHEESAVAAFVRNHPEAQARLLALDPALEPLSWDQAALPPADLASRAIAQTTGLELAGASSTAKLVLRGFRPSRRLIEAAVAAAVLVLGVGVFASWIG